MTLAQFRGQSRASVFADFSIRGLKLVSYSDKDRDNVVVIIIIIT
jgi:hypothetical protein